jgi:hypothetical protein
MDISSISAALTSLNAAKDIAKALLELKSLGEVQSKVIDLQNQILAAQGSALEAQGEQFEVKKKLTELEQEIARLRAWEKERARYTLIELSPGVFVQSVKDDARENEPKHWLCCNCFNEGEKSILQFLYESGNSRRYKCHRCASEITVKNTNSSPSSPRSGTGGSWMTA